MGYRLTVDTGGTFSDFVYWNEQTNEIAVAKLPSTPDDPSRAILAGVQHLLDKGVPASDIRYFCHGTTVGTNALLEGKGVRTGLLVTKGFRGIYEVAEQSRPYGAAIFDILYDKPALLVPASRTGEALERISAQGEVLTELDETQLRQTVRALAAQNVRSVAVCFLFSFLRPEHEIRARVLVEEEIPGCSVSLSSEIVPQIREYYRLSTTVINAYLQPILAQYIARLTARLNDAGVSTRQKYIMQSNGGMSTFEGSARKAVATVLSGPAGGVAASVQTARATSFGNLITFDMGGTSCDVALIKDGAASISNRGKVEGRDIALPMIDINTVSAGGGTLARVDRLGQLRVGPESAGALPGPACYGRGGTEPTITDCNLVLGYLDEENFLGGEMRLNARAAHAAIAAMVAAPLGMTTADAAEGVVRIIDVKMQEAIKAISTMRGHDLRGFHLLAFGGAGPLHAARIAVELGMAGVIVPLYPGVYSAMGLLMSDVAHDYVRSKFSVLAETGADRIAEVFADLERQALHDLHEEAFSRSEIRLERMIDMRYAGQGYEIGIACDGTLDADTTAGLRARFDALHRRMFGHTAPDEPVEIISYRLRGIGLVPPVTLPRFAASGMPLEEALRETRKARFAGTTMDCPVYRRAKLDVGVTFEGPAIVDQLDCTTVIPPGHRVRVDAFKNMIVTGGAPVTAAASPSGLGAVDIEIIKASLDGIVQEMQNSLFRTGFSTIVRESQDASCAIMAPNGDVVAQHVVLPLHIGSFPACCAAVLNAYDDIADGDAFLINHPYEGGSPHAPDMALITPVFSGGGLIAFCASIAHKSDIGGPVPGSCSGQAREIYNEGLHLPAVRYQRGGVRDVEIERIIAANSRTPELVLGDIRGQLGASRLGEQRMAELIAKYGRENITEAFARLLDLSERTLSAAIAEWTDGRYEAERFIDDDGIDLHTPVRIHVVVEKRGAAIGFDFSGSADQTKGPANVRPPLVRAAIAYCLIALVDPHIFINSGIMRAFALTVRKGSVVDPRFPAPLNTYNPTVHALVEAVFAALVNIVPSRARADGCGSRSIILGGRATSAGKSYVQYEILGGGGGARSCRDGMSGTSVNQSNAKIASIEIIESEFPTRVLRFELIADSGGAGEFRGGLGIVREYLNLQDARFSIRSAKHVIAPNGAAGGADGRTGNIVVNPGRTDEKQLPTRYADYPLKAGDVFRLDTPGGGGFGDAFARDPKAVLADLHEGYVSAAQAEDAYGVVVTGTPGHWTLDEAGTEARRAGKKRQRETAATFGRSKP